MYEPSGRQSANLAFLWPAFVAASASDMSALIAKHFANLAVGPAGAQAPEPKWSTSHNVALELNSVLPRDFTVDVVSFAQAILCRGAGFDVVRPQFLLLREDRPPALLCTPEHALRQ